MHGDPLYLPFFVSWTLYILSAYVQTVLSGVDLRNKTLFTVLSHKNTSSNFVHS